MIPRALFSLGLVALLVAGLAPEAAAGPNGTPIRTVAVRPAATLLLPYFEVDLADARGITTRFTVNNADRLAVLAHVVVWSDLAVPVLTFDLYLTGYDVAAVDLREVLAGTLPATATAGQDPGDAISPKGPFSQDLNFASCNGALPPAPLPPDQVAAVRAALTGQFSPLFGGCCGRSLGDGRARGYVTVDTVLACSTLTPREPAYFAGIVSDDNVLWGDFAYLRAGRNPLSVGGPLVHVVADGLDPEASTPGGYTFYGPYVNWAASDHRLPLATTFAARYFNVNLEETPSPLLPFTRGTTLVVWRDPKVSQGAFPCDDPPEWYPLLESDVVAFDEQENPEDIPPFPPALVFPPPEEPVARFPAAAQTVAVNGDDLPVSFNSGWIFLNLNQSNPVAGANPPENPAAAQAWVMVLHDVGGRLSTGHNAIQMDTAAKIEPGGGGVLLVP